MYTMNELDQKFSISIPQVILKGEGATFFLIVKTNWREHYLPVGVCSQTS